MFYGSGHGDTSYGIDEILGEGRAARVDIHESKPWAITEMWNRYEMKSQLGATPDPDKPYGRYYVDENRAEKFPVKPASEMTPGEIDFSRLNSAAEGMGTPQSAKPPAPAKGNRPARPHGP